MGKYPRVRSSKVLDRLCSRSALFSIGRVASEFEPRGSRTDVLRYVTECAISVFFVVPILFQPTEANLASLNEQISRIVKRLSQNWFTLNIFTRVLL